MLKDTKIGGMSSEEADLRAEIGELNDFDFGRQRSDIACRHRISFKTLDRIYAEEHKPLRKARSGLTLTEIELWPEVVDGADMLDGLSKAIRRFIVLDPESCDAVALWIAHAHAHGAFAISPILLITAPTKGCGKSTLLDVIARVVPRPLLSAATTAAALYRSAERIPTILCDEGDTYLSSDMRLVTFFNAGHRRGVPFRLCEGEDNRPREYPSWCPKAIAQIGLPRVPQIIDRSIVVELRRKRPSEQCREFSFLESYPDIHEVARRCARWTDDIMETLGGMRPVLPQGFENRLADNWRPLFAIAEAAGGDWPNRARRAASALGEIVDDDLEIMLLEDFREIFDDRDFAFTEQAVSFLNGMSERPWNSLRQGRGIDGNRVARMLRGFGIQPERIQNGSTRRRGYQPGQFTEVWSRYLEGSKDGESRNSFLDPSDPSSLSADLGLLDTVDGRDGPASGPSVESELGAGT
ncbi:MAG: DUF3631 domain-containing protein [Myxococcales bacterium]|nr:DUF3631 domain-containing protein [Myxococcales bacterium]